MKGTNWFGSCCILYIYALIFVFMSIAYLFLNEHHETTKVGHVHHTRCEKIMFFDHCSLKRVTMLFFLSLKLIFNWCMVLHMG